MDVGTSCTSRVTARSGVQLADLLRSGSSVRAAAQELLLDYAEALRFAHQHQLPVRSRRLDERTDATIRDLLAAGMSIRGIAEVVGVSYSAVYSRASEDGTRYRLTVTAKDSTAARCQFLILRLAGVTRRSAAACIGISLRTALDYEKGLVKTRHGSSRFVPKGLRAIEYKKLMNRFEQQHQHVATSQVTPAIPAAKADDHLREINSRYLSFTHRERIRDLHQAGYSNAAIARELGCHRSTIGRELARNADQQGRYLPSHASRLAWTRRRRPKIANIAADSKLREIISTKLEMRWSPEQIAAWLRLEYPDCLHWHVCHETIYQALYVQARGGLKRELVHHLRRGRSARKPRTSCQQRTPRFKAGMINISQRPPEVDDRAVPGHWESDLIIGAGGKSAIGTLVERTTRFVMLLHLPGRHDADSVTKALSQCIGKLPDALRRSLTWDQGSEMALHDQFSVTTGCPVYFCDPASPWQRGSNENTNGLLRQYFPKGTDLSTHSAEHLLQVADELNTRPRKTLGWKTPAQALTELIR